MVWRAFWTVRRWLPIILTGVAAVLVLAGCGGSGSSAGGGGGGGGGY